MMFGKQDIEGFILKTLDFDAGRRGHSVDTICYLMVRMRIIKSAVDDMAVRLCIAELIQEGRLCMNPNGTLYPPKEEDDPIIEKFRGDFFVNVDGRILGPMEETEAKRHADNEKTRRNISVNVHAGR